MKMAAVEYSEFEELCRICATKITAVSAIDIFETEGVMRQISKKICTCLPIQVHKTDKFPKYICENCLHKLDLFFDFRESSARAQTVFVKLYEEFTSVQAHNDDQQSFIVPMDHNELVVVQRHQILDEDSLQLTRLGEGEDAIVKEEIILTHDNVDMNLHSLGSIDLDNHDLNSQDLSNHSLQSRESIIVGSQTSSKQHPLLTGETVNFMQEHKLLSDQFRLQQHYLDVDMTDVNSEGGNTQLTNNYINCDSQKQNQELNFEIKIECDEIKLEDDEDDEPDLVDIHLVDEQLNNVSAPSSVTDKQMCHFNIESSESLEHLSNNKDEVYCKICRKMYEEKSVFEEHYKSHLYQCATCATVFMNADGLNSHRKDGACVENTKAESSTEQCGEVVVVDLTQKNSLESLEECKGNGENRRCRKRKDYCLFCKSYVSNFARHLLRNHSTEKEVEKIMTFSPKDKTRMKLLSDLRKKGNFLNPTTRKPVKYCGSNVKILPCTNCLGYFSAKRLCRHRKACMGTSDRLHQVKAQNLLLKDLKIDNQLRDKVFLRMRPDEISMKAKTDELICAFGARYFKGHSQKHFVTVTSRKMRELARLLIEIQNLKPSIENLFEALRSDNFGIIVSATKVVGQYNEENEFFESATTALNLGTSIKQCCQIAIVFIHEGKQVRPTLTLAEAEADLRTLIRLIDSKWRCEISIKASKVLNTKKLLLLMEKRVAAHCKGKSLDEINNMKKLLLLMEKRDEAAHCKGKGLDEKNIGVNENDNDSGRNIQSLPEDSEVISDYSLPGTSQDIQLPRSQDGTEKKSKRRVLTPWTHQQKEVVRQYFATHIKKKMAPKKHECLDLKDKHVTLLENKDWLKIKVFVQNEYVKRNR